MKWYELAQKFESNFRKGDLFTCIEETEAVIKKLPDSPYKIALDLDFINSAQEISHIFESFIDTAKCSIPLKSIYTETNGFDINPDEWYFEIFAYNQYGGHEDYEWLCNWNLESEAAYRLRGMEPLQAIYSTYKFDNVTEFSSLLVVLKFQNLIQSGVNLLANKKVPILATSHDYDIIYECGV